MKEKNDETWQDVNQTYKITDVTHKVTTMKKDKDYTFRIVAVNDIGKSEPSDSSDYLKLKKTEIQEPPTIVDSLKSVIVSRKEQIILSCVVRGTPKPEVTWYKDEKMFKSKSITFENCVARYEIPEAKETSSGVYRVRAKNDAGEAETTCTVKVQERPEIEIDDSLVSQKLRVNNQWKVVTNYKGYPQPDIEWNKNDVEIQSDKHCSIYTDEKTTTIAIYSLQREDSGTYQVTAKNEAGKCSAQINLKVIGKKFSFLSFFLSNLFTFFLLHDTFH